MNFSEKANQRLDGAAFDQLFEQFSPGIRAFLRSKLANEADVEDGFSRIFEKLWTHGTSVNPAARGAWLFVVARRETALLWRNKKHSEERLEAFSIGIVESIETDSPELQLIQNENIAELRKAAAELPPEQREVLHKRFFDNLTFREIADELQVPIGTALTRLHTALKRLRTVLHDYDKK